MIEQIYKYRATCDGDGCGLIIDYETTKEHGLPDGWVQNTIDCPYDEPSTSHYCSKCWIIFAAYMISCGCSEYKYRLDKSQKRLTKSPTLSGS